MKKPMKCRAEFLESMTPSKYKRFLIELSESKP
jgi:hypothetical protein